VEVKRSTDTRLRREVVGQMLDYAANAVVYSPVEHLIEHFRASAYSVRRAEPMPTRCSRSFSALSTIPPLSGSR
jgi:hypothetical protein